MKRPAAAVCLFVACAWGEGTGQYSAMLEQDPGLPTHTIYRPQDLSAVKEKLPIIAWGNGGCANNGLAHRNFLMEIASHGYLAIAIGPPARQGGPGAAPGRGARPAGQAPAGPATKSSQLIDAINWALAENSRSGSSYYEKLTKGIEKY